MNMMKKLEHYYSKHVWYAKTFHILTGVGIGILLTYPLVGDHPLRWGLTILVLGLLGSLAPWLKR